MQEYFEKEGEDNEAFADFKNLKLFDIKPLEINNGFYGYLHNGGTVILRLKNTDGRPTLEFHDVDNKIRIIRYIKKKDKINK